MRTFLILLASSIIGLFLGLGIGAISGAALFTSAWEELPETPSRAVDLYNQGDTIFIVQTEDGNSWNYSLSKGWIEAGTADEEAVLSRPMEIVDPCDRTSSEFSFLRNAPKEIDDCIQVTQMYADGSTFYSVVLDKNGRVWIWEKTESGYSMLGQKICCPGIGAILGAVMGVILVVRKKRKSMKTDSL